MKSIIFAIIIFLCQFKHLLAQVNADRGYYYYMNRAELAIIKSDLDSVVYYYSKPGLQNLRIRDLNNFLVFLGDKEISSDNDLVVSIINELKGRNIPSSYFTKSIFNTYRSAFTDLPANDYCDTPLNSDIMWVLDSLLSIDQTATKAYHAISTKTDEINKKLEIVLFNNTNFLFDLFKRNGYPTEHYFGFCTIRDTILHNKQETPLGTIFIHSFQMLKDTTYQNTTKQMKSLLLNELLTGKISPGFFLIVFSNNIFFDFNLKFNTIVKYQGLYYIAKLFEKDIPRINQHRKDYSFGSIEDEIDKIQFMKKDKRYVFNLLITNIADEGEFNRQNQTYNYKEI